METAMAPSAGERALTEAITQASAALMRAAQEEPGRWWTAYELKVNARNGFSAGVMGLALRRLIDEGELERRSDYRVRVAS
jgi:hypothetical protein